MNERIINALRRLLLAADAYIASQDRATDPRCGIVQPVTVDEANELIAAYDEAAEVLEELEKP